MKRLAWLLTHDSHIDRRVMSFVDAFVEMGLDVKMFGNSASPETWLEDPQFVVRPMETRIVRSFGSHARWSSRVPPPLKQALDAAIEFQNGFYICHGRFAAEHDMLNLHTIPEGMQRTVFSANEKWFMLSLEDAETRLIYCRQTGNVYVESVTSHDPAFDAIIRQMCNSFTPDRDRMYLKPNSVEPTTVGESCLDGTNVLWSFNSYRSTGYVYNQELRVVTEHVPFAPAKFEQPDVLGNRVFDYPGFRRVIYDYSILLRLVNDELQSSRRIPDLVYVADLPSLPVGHMLKERYGCKLVVDCHEWWKGQSELWAPENRSLIELSDHYERALYKQSDLRITVGELLSDEMSNYFHSEFHGIFSTLPTSPVATAKLREQLWNEKGRLPRGTRVAVFQGSLTTHRNLEVLAEATRYLQDGQALAIVGDGPFRHKFTKILESSGNPDRCIFTGWVSQSELAAYTSCADIGIIPYSPVNHYYSLSMPNKLFEYLAAHRPILCDEKMSEISRVVRLAGVGNCVDCTNPETLGTAVSKMLANDAQQKVWSDAYRSGFAANLHKEQIAKIVRLVRQTLDAPQSAGETKTQETCKIPA